MQLLTVLLFTVLPALASAALIPRKFARKTCFVCPSVDETKFPLATAVYTQGEPTVCEYAQNSIAGFQIYSCIYSRTTGKIAEDHNGGACPTRLEFAPCPRRDSEYDSVDDYPLPREKLFEQSARVKRNGRSGDARKLSLQAQTQARKRADAASLTVTLTA